MTHTIVKRISLESHESKQRGLHINGVVADFYSTGINRDYDLILCDSIFHFEKQDRDKELQLLTDAVPHLRPNGLICIFIHTSNDNESIIKLFFATSYPHWNVVADRSINYIYEEKNAHFKSSMQFSMYFVQNVT